MNEGGAGYQRIATALSLMFDYSISRQQVFMWWKRRAFNGFPEGHKRATGGGSVREFTLDDVVEWFRTTYPEARLERLRCQRRARREGGSTTASDGSSTI